MHEFIAARSFPAQPNSSINYPIPVGSRRSNRPRRQPGSSSRAEARRSPSPRDNTDPLGNREISLSLSLSRFEKAAAEIAIGSINAARGCNRASSRRVSRLMIVGGFQPPSSFLSALLLSEEDNKRAVRLCVCVCVASVEIVIERSNAGISFFARIDHGSIQQTFKTSV